MFRSVFRVAACCGAAVVSLPAFGQTVIADLAPTSAFVIVGCDDVAGARGAFDRTGMTGLVREPSVQTFLDEVFEAGAVAADFEEFDEWLTGAGVEWRELPPPTGAAGFAMILEAVPDDPERELWRRPSMSGRMSFLVFADFGEGADKIEEAMTAVFDEFVDRDEGEYDQDEHNGVTIHILKVAPAGMDPGDGDEPPELHVARVGGSIIAATKRPLLEHALDRLAGDRIESLSDHADYADTMAQHPAGNHGYAAIFINKAVREEIAASFAPMLEFMGPEGMSLPAVAHALGVDELRSFSVAARLDTASAMFEETIGVLARERRGLLDLLDAPSGPFDPPAFVAADSASVVRIGVRFDRVWPLVESVIKTLPEESARELEMGLAQASGIARPILDALGTHVVVATAYRRPFAADSEQQVVAIEARDTLPISNVLAGFGPMAGLAAREFQGNQIFENTDVGQAFGLGFGFVFIGPPGAVENAMRAAATPDMGRLASEDRFRAAASPLAPAASVYGYTDVRRTLEWVYWSVEHANEIFLAEMEPFIEDEEDRQMMREHAADLVPEWFKHLPPAEVLLRYLGDSSFELVPSADGFRGRQIQLRPSRPN